MVKKFRSWLRCRILSWMFTPVRALKLDKAAIRPGEKVVTITSYCTHNHWSLSVHYGGSCESFYYKDKSTFAAERQILEGMIP